VNQTIGRLRERYSRVGRSYQIRYEAEQRAPIWEVEADLKRRAERLDGSYVLKTDRRDMSKEEIWRQYILLTRVESAFRAMKSPLMERPIFHQLAHRVETHIFLCVLAYHLLATVEKTFLDQGIHTSWDSLREQLAGHQAVTVVLPTSDGRQIRIRKATTPEPEHKAIYQALRIPETIIEPVRSRIVTERPRKRLISRDRAFNYVEVGLTHAQLSSFAYGARGGGVGIAGWSTATVAQGRGSSQVR
jgi:hypothetical protein